MRKTNRQVGMTSYAARVRGGRLSSRAFGLESQFAMGEKERGAFVAPGLGGLPVSVISNRERANMSSRLASSRRVPRGFGRARLALAAVSLGLVAAGSCGGGEAAPPLEDTGGRASGGASTGGNSTGGAATGGAATGGAATGGAKATGGATGGSITPSTGGRGATGTGGAGTGGGGGKVGGAPGTAGQGSGGSGAGGAASGATKSQGCGQTSTLKNTPSTSIAYNMITSGGMSRKYALRLPQNYDNGHPYRLVFDLHGANGSAAEGVNSGFYGLYALSGGSTIFVALEAVSGLWSAARDTTYANDVLAEVEKNLCIDTTRVELEGFSQGAAMSWTLACSKGGVFRAAVGHSGGGVANPTKCDPIAYMGSLGIQESSGKGADHGQGSQTDQFAKWNGCTITSLPGAPSGGHVCTNYTGCPDSKPVRWCSYDAGHTPSPSDKGQSSSWMPKEVWGFLSVL